MNISEVWGEKKLLNASTWSLSDRKKINLFISLKVSGRFKREKKGKQRSLYQINLQEVVYGQKASFASFYSCQNCKWNK